MNAIRCIDDDLKTSAEFLQRVKEDSFALDAYHFLRGAILHEDGTRHSMSMRTIGEAIAELRGVGEDYTAFYLSDFGRKKADDNAAGTHDAEISRILGDLGWHAMSVELEVDYYRLAITMIDAAERRAVKHQPAWYGRSYPGEKPEDLDGPTLSPGKRLRRCARDGQIDQLSWCFARSHIWLSDHAASYGADYKP